MNISLHILELGHAVG